MKDHAKNRQRSSKMVRKLGKQSSITAEVDFTSERLEDDPAWQMLQKPAKIKNIISPEKLEELMEETIWQE